jgi:chromosome segregation ATPase
MGTGSMNMLRVCFLALLAAAVPAAAPQAFAQDVQGIELCTKESRMDRRTGCLQSNVEYLQQLLTKSALDVQQKLAAATREIAVQKEAAAAATREIATLRDTVTDLKARIDRAQQPKPTELTPAAAAATKEIAALRDAVNDLRARIDQAQKPAPAKPGSK